VKRILFLTFLLGGCATTPTGPGVLVLPGTGKSFDQFRFDEHECRQYAHAQVGGSSADQAAADAEGSGRTLQQRYDFGYQQCMYAKGHKIPMAREEAARHSRYRSAPPPPPPPDYRVN